MGRSVALSVAAIIPVFFAALPASAYTVTTIQVTSDPAPQLDPAVSAGKVAWTDYRSGTADIWVYDIGTATYTQLTSDAFNQTLADISGSLVVYTDDRAANLDVYSFDLSTAVETQITTNSANQINPAVRGARIAWEDDRGPTPNIWALDPVTLISSAVDANATFPQAHPAISGDVIVWQDLRNGAAFNIYKHDFVANVTTAITNNTTFNCLSPDIDGDWAVYQCDAGGVNQIYARNLVTLVETQITTATADQRNPKISGSFVVWEDYTNGPANSDLLGYDLVTAQTMALATGPSNQRLHDVSGFDVAYTDNAAGNDDIYVLHVEPTGGNGTGDPCDPANGATVLFDETFLRGKGKPQPQTRSFASAAGATGTMCLSLDRVSAAKVTLDGTDVFVESDFNATLTSLSKPVALSSANVLTVLIKGKPHGEVEKHEPPHEAQHEGHDGIHERDGHGDGDDVHHGDGDDDGGDSASGDDHVGESTGGHACGGGSMRVRVVGPVPPPACDVSMTGAGNSGILASLLLAGIAVALPRARRRR